MADHTLNSIIKKYLIRHKDTSQHGHVRMLDIATDGIREMSMDVSGLLKSAKLTIQDNNTVYLPKDYMDYVSIGICVNGKVFPLGVNNKICLNFTYSDCGVEQSHTGSSINTQPSEGSVITSYGENHRNGEFIGRHYGLGGGNNPYGKFRVDNTNGRIILDILDNTYTEVVLEYTYDPSLVDGLHIVHSYQVNALLAYMYWQDINMSMNHPIGEKQRAQRNWIDQKVMAKRRHNSFTLREALETSRRHVMGAPRL